MPNVKMFEQWTGQGPESSVVTSVSPVSNVAGHTTSVRGPQDQFMLLSACTANSAKCFVRLLPQWIPATTVYFCCKACYKIVSIQRSSSCWVELRGKFPSFYSWWQKFGWPKAMKFRNVVLVNVQCSNHVCPTLSVFHCSGLLRSIIFFILQNE
jgi:hypothetical protein